MDFCGVGGPWWTYVDFDESYLILMDFQKCLEDIYRLSGAFRPFIDSHGTLYFLKTILDIDQDFRKDPKWITKRAVLCHPGEEKEIKCRSSINA